MSLRSELAQQKIVLDYRRHDLTPTQVNDLWSRFWRASGTATTSAIGRIFASRVRGTTRPSSMTCFYFAGKTQNRHDLSVRDKSMVNFVSSRNEDDVFHIGGMKIRVLEDGTRTGGRLSTFEVTVPPMTTGKPLHIHRSHDETYFVLRGTLDFQVANGRYRGSPGDFFVVRIGVAHCFSNPFPNPAVFLITITPAESLNYFRELAQLSKAGAMDLEAIRQTMLRFNTDLAEPQASTAGDEKQTV